MEESRRQGSSNALRPPAMVTEYMSQGSLKMALARKADVVQGAMHRLCIAMDAAKARPCAHLGFPCELYGASARGGRGARRHAPPVHRHGRRQGTHMHG